MKNVKIIFFVKIITYLFLTAVHFLIMKIIFLKF